jgi:hypothetical protein
MSIPVQADYDLSDIQNASDLVMLKLKIMRHSAKKADLPRLRAELRVRLQEFVEQAMSFADEVANEVGNPQ